VGAGRQVDCGALLLFPRLDAAGEWTARFADVIKGFSHVQLVVGDIETSARWYGVVLGMELLERGSFAGGDYAALRSPTGRFVIGMQTASTTDASGAPMIEHLSFAVEDRDDLERHRAAIVATGIEAGDLIEEVASWNIRFRDPDGLVVELTAAKSAAK